MQVDFSFLLARGRGGGVGGSADAGDEVVLFVRVLRGHVFFRLGVTNDKRW